MDQQNLPEKKINAPVSKNQRTREFVVKNTGNFINKIQH